MCPDFHKLPQMATRPIACRRLVFCRLAVVAGAEIGSAFRIFVLSVVLISPCAVRDFLDLIALFPEDDELFGGTLGSLFRLVEAGKGLSHVLDFSRRESLEAGVCHKRDSTD